MLSDFLSKPLQGSLFRKFRDVLLGAAHISTLTVPSDASARPVERVEQPGVEIPVTDGSRTKTCDATRTYADVVKNNDVNNENNKNNTDELTAHSVK